MKILTTTIQSLVTGNQNKWLLGILVVLFVGYSACIVRTVVAVNERKMTYTELREQQTKVSELEMQYFNLAKNIDMEKAATLGFRDASGSRFVYTQTNSETVAFAPKNIR